MKKIIASLLLSPVVYFAQPNITKAEDFKIGTVLRFMECEPENVNEGNSGKDQTWDFSKLKAKNDTVTEWMVAPSSVANASLFPTCTFIEKYSDGKYVYASNDGKQNQLLGFEDTKLKMIIKYPDPILFAVRPMIMGTRSVDNFKDQFSFGAMNFVGTGTCTIEADGFGTLILPNGKFQNVLRVKITQLQNDTLIQYKSLTVTKSVTYVWFDEKHSSALLKIDSTDSGTYKSKSVEFLLSETYEDKKK